MKGEVSTGFDKFQATSLGRCLSMYALQILLYMKCFRNLN